MKPKWKAKRRPKPELPPNIDSRYEGAYVKLLESWLTEGKIQAYTLKPGSRRLGPDLRYEPDFEVINADGEVEYHEIKGRTKFAEKGIIKLKAAAEKYPYFHWKLIYGHDGKDPETGQKKVVFETPTVIGE